ncbi:hypothetical protein ACH9L7_20240 (plasmid) [Haloferax sp. S1W]|uniref:hypothetical protein n=1 Tax=Haloferax sp. S1W TaxID=3377110 RepID=UPI0037C75E3E
MKDADLSILNLIDHIEDSINFSGLATEELEVDVRTLKRQLPYSNSSNWIRSRCKVLDEHGFLEEVDNNVFKLTSKGREFVDENGELTRLDLHEFKLGVGESKH